VIGADQILLATLLGLFGLLDPDFAIGTH